MPCEPLHRDGGGSRTAAFWLEVRSRALAPRDAPASLPATRSQRPRMEPGEAGRCPSRLRPLSRLAGPGRALPPSPQVKPLRAESCPSPAAAARTPAAAVTAHTGAPYLPAGRRGRAAAAGRSAAACSARGHGQVPPGRGGGRGRGGGGGRGRAGSRCAGPALPPSPPAGLRHARPAPGTLPRGSAQPAAPGGRSCGCVANVTGCCSTAGIEENNKYQARTLPSRGAGGVWGRAGIPVRCGSHQRSAFLFFFLI